MAIVLINPNSTEEMTQSALAAARRTSPGLTFEGWTSAKGPPAIEGEADGRRAVPPLLELVQKASDGGASAIVIACFDDTGLAEARAIAACPVIGIGQSSFVMAGLLADRVTVITTVAAAVPVIEGNIAASGFAHLVTGVHAANVPVLALEHSPAEAARGFIAAARALDPAPSLVILGCAGAVTIRAEVSRALGCPVLDGVTAAARLCRAFSD
ncbi:aspartate/glutamate racemase family protein [Aestuariicoccus sp. MJ-SS9]|uniref:aspartate/glutamate racemase family protein n=1 Tax=Aestuariicoccus sp. MJ-SS9 TaxID=3079855 RepID=UPI00290746ED|nr:aspartate/glutamate racemase family protein [Aestuariicoccus sp. MJ-SS9]MDU8913900.1 aspartate/glutamate racemase family protein [Aestuariicoccus sp. MJ-SS9]